MKRKEDGGGGYSFLHSGAFMKSVMTWKEESKAIL